MKNKIKSIMLILILFIFGAVISIFLSADKEILIVNNEFLITIVGVILGISATIITFIFSSTDKIRRIIDSIYYYDRSKAKSAKEKFKNGYKELIDDCEYIFIMFLLLMLCITWSSIDIPIITFSTKLPKVKVLNAIKIGTFLNCLYATCDLFFSLANILRLVVYEN